MGQRRRTGTAQPQWGQWSGQPLDHRPRSHLVSTLTSIGMDLVAIIVLVFGLYVPRHNRRDLVVAFLGVNVGVMAVSAALLDSAVTAGLGLGLFGVLSIIRLRSDELAQHEVAYYFSALALGLLGGVSVGPVWLERHADGRDPARAVGRRQPAPALAQPPPADGARPRLRPGARDDRAPRGAARRDGAGRHRAAGRPRQRRHLGRGALPAAQGRGCRDVASRGHPTSRTRAPPSETDHAAAAGRNGQVRSGSVR